MQRMIWSRILTAGTCVEIKELSLLWVIYRLFQGYNDAPVKPKRPFTDEKQQHQSCIGSKPILAVASSIILQPIFSALMLTFSISILWHWSQYKSNEPIKRLAGRQELFDAKIDTRSLRENGISSAKRLP